MGPLTTRVDGDLRGGLRGLDGLEEVAGVEGGEGVLEDGGAGAELADGEEREHGPRGRRLGW